MIKAIETSYKGYRFRSRLEARWAVFFDALGIKWEYEKEGYDLGEYGYYLPDFWLPECGFHAEVKPDGATTEYEAAKLRIFDDFPPVGSLGVIMLRGLPDYFCVESDVFVPVDVTITSTWHIVARCAADVWDMDGIKKAITAARSARFEHGESPKV